jgi:microcystin-dependent protein
MASDTYTSDIGAILMGTGNDNNNWGNLLNNSGIQVICDAIANVLASTVTGGTLDLSGSPPPAAPSQVRHESLTFTGTLTANQVVKVPNLAKRWRINNTCALSGFTLSVQTPGGSGSIATLGAITGGAGYVNGSYANVPLTGGSGAGATANITVAGGAVTVVTPLSKGRKYLATDTLSAAAASIGGTGSGFSVPVAAIANVIPAGSGEVRCDGAGNIAISGYWSTSAQQPDGAAAAPSFTFANELGSGWYRNGPQDVRLAVGGTDILQVTGAGAGSPDVVNALSGAVFQQAGVPLLPAGMIVDYAGVVPPAGWYMCYGQTVSRAADAGLFNAITVIGTANTHGGTTLDNISPALADGAALIGAIIEGTGIPSGTTLVGVSSATSIVMSQAATASSTGIAVRFIPYGNGDGSTTFNIPDLRGCVAAGRVGMGNTTSGGLTTASIATSPYGLAGRGGAETITLTTAQIPSHTHNYSGISATGNENQGHTHLEAIAGGNFNAQVSGNTGVSGYVASVNSGQTGGASNPHTHNFSWSGTTDGGTGTGAAHNNVQPTAMVTKIIKR